MDFEWVALEIVRVSGIKPGTTVWQASALPGNPLTTAGFYDILMIMFTLVNPIVDVKITTLYSIKWFDFQAQSPIPCSTG